MSLMPCSAASVLLFIFMVSYKLLLYISCMLMFIILVELSREETASRISKRSNLSARQLEKEARRAIGDNLASEWKRAQAGQ